MRYPCLRIRTALLSALVPLWLLAQQTALAQPNQIVIRPGKSDIKTNIVRVLAPGAECSDVSIPGSVYVVGVHDEKESALLLFPFDANGDIAKPGQPTRVVLPKPASLAAYKTWPSSISAHPRLPLIYVWWDLQPQANQEKELPKDVIHRDFDHLLIYKIANGNAQLVKSMARGDGYNFAVGNHGSIVVDAAADKPAEDDRLHLPNLNQPNDSETTPYIPLQGYANLGPDGMPIETEGKPALVTRVDQVSHAHIGRPLGLVPISKEVVMIGTLQGIASRSLVEPEIINSILTYGNSYPRIVGHPSKQVVYGISIGYTIVHGIEHINGVFSTIPLEANIAGMSARSFPVFDRVGNRLLIGGHQGLFLLHLDENGRFTGTSEYVTFQQAVTTIACHPKSDRIYVPLEKLE